MTTKYYKITFPVDYVEQTYGLNNSVFEVNENGDVISFVDENRESIYTNDLTLEGDNKFPITFYGIKYLFNTTKYNLYFDNDNSQFFVGIIQVGIINGHNIPITISTFYKITFDNNNDNGTGLNNAIFGIDTNNTDTGGIVNSFVNANGNDIYLPLGSDINQGIVSIADNYYPLTISGIRYKNNDIAYRLLYNDFQSLYYYRYDAGYNTFTHSLTINSISPPDLTTTTTEAPTTSSSTTSTSSTSSTTQAPTTTSSTSTTQAPTSTSSTTQAPTTSSTSTTTTTSTTQAPTTSSTTSTTQAPTTSSTSTISSSTTQATTTLSVINSINSDPAVQQNLSFNDSVLTLTGDITLGENNNVLNLPVDTTLFDGNGYTITIPTSVEAVFNIQNNSLLIIQNIHAISPFISNIGGGSIIEKNSKNVRLINCSFRGNLKNLNQGGIIGSGCKNITLHNCHFYGDIYFKHCGGLIGKRCKNIKIYNCSANGVIIKKYSSGLVGSYSKNIKIYKSYYNGIKLRKTGSYLGLKCRNVKIIIEKDMKKKFKNNLHSKNIKVKYI
jgi:hypothetical protein